MLITDFPCVRWNEKHLLKTSMWFFDYYDQNDDNELSIEELGNLLSGAKG